ncbi:hypothetical protein N8783_05350 [Alphaproteobacteria bacterium]|nr:hypothetical protein [Alphaproteobacteria bacterium]
MLSQMIPQNANRCKTEPSQTAPALPTGAGLGIKNSKKDTEDLTDFIGALNRLESAYQKLSPRAKQQISYSSYSLGKQTNCRQGNVTSFSKLQHFTRNWPYQLRTHTKLIG